MQGVPSLVQQGTSKCAKCQACEQFYQLNSIIQLPTRQLKELQTPPQHRPSSMPGGWDCCKPSVPRDTEHPKRGRFFSRRRISRRGEELNYVLWPLLDPSISCLTWHTGSLGWCQLAPAHPDPERRVGGLQESFESKLRKIFANPVQQHSSTISTPAKAVRKTLCKEVLHCIYLFCWFACRFMCAGVI